MCLPLLLPLLLLLLLLPNDNIPLQLLGIFLILKVSVLQLPGLIFLNQLPLFLFFLALLHLLGFGKVADLLLSLPFSLPSHGVYLSHPFSLIILCLDSCLYIVLFFQLDPSLLLLLCLIHLPQLGFLSFELILDVPHPLLVLLLLLCTLGSCISIGSDLDLSLLLGSNGILLSLSFDLGESL